MDSAPLHHSAHEPALATCHLYRCDQIPYEVAWQWQKQLLARGRDNAAQLDTLLLLEHPAVYTLGQGADDRFLKFSPHPDLPPVIKIERGGEVTYHCPGQLVGYPILNLRRHRADLHWYLRQLEEVIIRTVAVLGLTGERLSGLTGVWIAGYKVAAIGIKVSRWITMHGFAVNINPDLTGFQKIVPCGISDKPVGSLAQFIPGITRQQVQPILEQQFADVFKLRFSPQDPAQLRSLSAANPAG